MVFYAMVGCQDEMLLPLQGEETPTDYTRGDAPGCVFAGLSGRCNPMGCVQFPEVHPESFGCPLNFQDVSQKS